MSAGILCDDAGNRLRGAHLIHEIGVVDLFSALVVRISVLGRWCASRISKPFLDCA